MEYRVYSTRWAFITITSINVFSVVFMTYCYAGINDVITAYFQTTPFLIDLLATWAIFMTAVGLVVLALFKDSFGLRNQVLSTIVCTIIGSIVGAIGFSNRKWFYIVLSGQTFFGISSAIIFIIQIVLPANWFPVHETATVIGVFWASWSLGQAAAAGILPFVIGSLDATEAEFTFLKVKWTFLIVNGGIAFLHVLTGILSWYYLADHPPSSPSASQQYILERNTNQKPSITELLISNIKLILKIHRNREYILITLAHCLSTSVVVLTKILVASVFLDTFSNITDDDVAWIRLIGLLASAPASVVIGKITDETKKFKELTLTAHICLTIAGAGIVVGHRYKNFVCLAVLYPVTMVFGMFSKVTITELMIETTYPTNKIILMASQYFVIDVGTSVFTSITRYTLQTFGVLAAVSILLATCAISVLLLVAVRPHYKRLNMDMAEELEDETQTLLQEGQY
ncbi:solute carrier family 49 member A3-like [Styela clava]|uniref:solute carrier family 49 member A3-like n=1 Tax=Styela clava TaxID=7725 RepID=UPI0019396661|nr:solute carrier family 49 member A3-like [Styela clava]